MDTNSASSPGVSIKPKKRDAAYFRSILTKKGSKLVTSQKLSIDVPKAYEGKGLLEIRESVYFYGVCCFSSGERYSVGLIPALFETRPVNVTEVTIDDMVFYRMSYSQGSVVIENTEVVLRDLLTYGLFDLMIASGKVPWFISYEDFEKIFWNMRKFAGTFIGANPMANELISSYIARDKKTPEIFFRQTKAAQTEFSLDQFLFVGLKNVFYSAPTVLNKIAGNYFRDGLVSALMTEPKEMSQLEKAVRR